MAGRPLIVITSPDDDGECTWYSVGWNDAKHRGTPRAEGLMVRARTAIGLAKDVPDAVQKLTEAGFDVRRV